MPAIKITQELKDKNKKYGTAFIKNNDIGAIVLVNFPKKFYLTKAVSGGYSGRTDLHNADGWQTPIIPSVKADEKLGKDLIEVEGVYTYEVIEKTTEEIEAEAEAVLLSMPTLARAYCEENDIIISSREIDIQIDQIEIFEPREKVYHLLGNPISKEYYNNDTCIVRLEYSKIYEDRTHKGIINKNEFAATKTKFIFYKDEARTLFIEKEKITKNFNLVPTEINDDEGNLESVLWSSADREGVLRQERYKSEQVMKSFNPALYSLFTALWNDLYMTYKETGENSQLIQEISVHSHPVLDTEVMDDDKAVIFGPLENYPPLTVRQLIITALP